jgi:outer membrane protein assembly factor BamB
MTILRSVVVLLVLAQTAAAQQPLWPGFRGPHGDGVARADKPPTSWSDDENVAWKLDLPGAGASSPIVVGDRVLLTCYTGYGKYEDDGGEPGKLEQHLVCVDRVTGARRWQSTIPGALPKEARQIQINEHGFATPTPVSDGERVWVYFGHAGVCAFDLDGKKLWQEGLGKPTEGAPGPTNSVEREGQTLSLRWGSAASPLLHDGMVIVNASEQSNSIRALDQRTGKLVWKRESANLEGSAVSPMLAGSGAAQVVVIVLGGEVWGLEPKTGALRWQVETGTRGGMAPSPISDGEHVFAFGGGGKGFAIALLPDAEQRVVWQGENVDIPSPVLHDGRLLLVDQMGKAKCLRAADGEKLFGGRLQGRTGGVYAPPVFANGHLYVVSRERGVFVYRVGEHAFELVSRNELTEEDPQFHASPAVAGDALFLRSDRRLYCIAKSS